MIIIYDKKYQLSLNDLIITLGNFEKLENISINSNIKIFEKDFLLKSKIRLTNSTIKAAADLQTPLLELPDNQNFKIPPLKIKSNTTIDIKDETVSSTAVNIFENGNPVGKADIKLNYNKKNSALTINTLSTEIFELIKLAARGQILNISDDPGFEVEGKVENLNLEKLTKLITHQYGTEFSGNIENNNFDITGSIKDGLDIKGQAIFSDFLLKQDKDDFFFDELVLSSGLFLNADKKHMELKETE